MPTRFAIVHFLLGSVGTAGSEKWMQICIATTSWWLLIDHAHTYELRSTELAITYFTTGVEVRVCRVNDSITVDGGNVSLYNLQLQQVNRCISTTLDRDPAQALHLNMYQRPYFPTFTSPNLAPKEYAELCVQVCVEKGV